MSGARALAAARQRRAGPPNKNPSPVPSNGINNSSNVSTISQQNSTPQKMNPAMMLLSHNKIITNLQTVVEDLNAKFDNQREDLKEDAKVDDVTLDYYKNKIITIETSLEEIKKHTLKIQTFSMETSLQVTEIKKRFNRYEKKEDNEQDKQRDKIIENINNVSTILTKINSELEDSKHSQDVQNSTLVDILHGISNSVSEKPHITNIPDPVPVQGKEEVEEEEEVEVEEEPEAEVEEEPDAEVECENEGNDEGQDSTKLNF